MGDWMAPPEPPEGSNRLNAKDLKGHVVVFHPYAVGEDVGKDGKPWRFVVCDVWQIDRAGIVERDTEVRVSWWRAYEQLKACLGGFVPCKVVENEDRSVTLAVLAGQAAEVVKGCRDEITGDADRWHTERNQTPTPTGPDAGWDQNDEPF